MIRYSALALLCTLVLFANFDIDLWFQDFLYDFVAMEWMWNKQDTLLKLLFYTGAKGLVITIGLGALGTVVFSFRVTWLRPYRKACLLIFLSIALVPTTVSVLKSATNIPCPSKTERYGGQLPTTTYWDAFKINDTWEKRQKCFPAGHASGGFALLSIIFLFQVPFFRRLVTFSVFAFGSAMAFYKMAIGDHYLSHTLVTIELSILIIGSLGVKLGVISTKSQEIRS